MTRFPTSGVLLLLLALFTTPASAQVIMGGSPLGIPGSGTVTSIATTSPITGGTITSSGTIACATCTTSAGMTTGVIPMASGAHALVDSIISQASTVATVTGSLGVTTANTATGVVYVDGSGHLASGGDGSGDYQFSYIQGAPAVGGNSIDLSVVKLIPKVNSTDALTDALYAEIYAPGSESGNTFTGEYHGVNAIAGSYGAGTFTGFVSGGLFGGHNTGGTMSTLFGVGGFVLHQGAGTTTLAAGVYALMPTNSGAGTVTSAMGVLVENGSGPNPSTGAITNMYGVKINAQTGPTVTNQYGLWIDDIALGGTIKQAIHTGAGDVVLGTLTTTGAATGKKVVCVDTATGKLYASSAGNSCAN